MLGRVCFVLSWVRGTPCPHFPLATSHGKICPALQGVSRRVVWTWFGVCPGVLQPPALMVQGLGQLPVGWADQECPPCQHLGDVQMSLWKPWMRITTQVYKSDAHVSAHI